MKRCNECSEDKPLAAFSGCASAKDGLQWKCKACASARQRRVYHASPEARARKSATWQHHRTTKTEQVRASKRAYYEDNKERWAAWGAARASRMRRFAPWADRPLINDIYAYAKLVRGAGINCHVDHLVPLQGRLVSGLHVQENLTVLLAGDNLRKHNRFQVGV